MQILSVRERNNKGKVRYTAMCFRDRIEELRKDIIEAIRQLLDAHGLKEIKLPITEKTPYGLSGSTIMLIHTNVMLRELRLLSKHLTVTATIKDSMEEVCSQAPFELGASNIDWLNQMYEAVRLQLENTNANS